MQSFSYLLAPLILQQWELTDSHTIMAIAFAFKAHDREKIKSASHYTDEITFFKLQYTFYVLRY